MRVDISEIEAVVRDHIGLDENSARFTSLVQHLVERCSLVGKVSADTDLPEMEFSWIDQETIEELQAKILGQTGG